MINYGRLRMYRVLQDLEDQVADGFPGIEPGRVYDHCVERLVAIVEDDTRWGEGDK